VAPHAAAVDRDARFPHEAFDALREARLLSCYVPESHGGMGLTMPELARVCEALGGFCGSTAMVFAMHQIQVACVTHHAIEHPAWQPILADLVERQLLWASATTELGIGGDVRTSTCAVDAADGRFTLVKQAPVISYAQHADAILVTARRAPDAGPHDQVQVYATTADCGLVPISGWDTLGFRGTCSLGFTLTASSSTDRILPVPYAEIHAKTMHPFAHIVWGALWTGIAADAVAHARATVRRQARKTPGTLPPSALRLAEVDAVLSTMRAGVYHAAATYQARLEAHPGAPFPPRLRVLGGHLQPQGQQLPPHRRHRGQGAADLRHQRVPKRPQAQPGASPARQLRRRAHGQQRPHPGPERHDADHATGRVSHV
jgi:acyl-CoA dehydrogenase